MGLAGVILAAGESTRMGRDKALLPWPPEQISTAVTEHVGPGALTRADALRSPDAAPSAAGRARAPVRLLPVGQSLRAGSAPTRELQGTGTLLSHNIAALNGACDLVIVIVGKNESTLRPVVDASGGFLVRNPRPDLGQFSSLRVGLQEVLSQGRDSAMVTLVDRPCPASTTLLFLLDAFNLRPRGIWSVIPEFNAEHGHPILIGREMIEEFLRASSTANARDIEHANQQRILYMPVDDPLVTTNINTPEDYASLQSKA